MSCKAAACKSARRELCEPHATSLIESVARLTATMWRVWRPRVPDSAAANKSLTWLSNRDGQVRVTRKDVSDGDEKTDFSIPDCASANGEGARATKALLAIASRPVKGKVNAKEGAACRLGGTCAHQGQMEATE
jgi:hypothetical protein